MKSNALTILKLLLWTVCLAHLAIGAGLNLSPEAAPFLAKVYGAEVSWTPELTYILKPLGAFMFALGFIAAAAAMKPLRHRSVVYGFVILFLIRAAQRYYFATEIAETFSIDSTRNLANMGFFALLALALVVCERAASSAASRAG